MHTEAVRGPALSLGACLLADRMSDRGISAADVGRAVDAGRHLVCRWLSGQRRASLRYAVLLERLYGVPIASWAEPPPKRHSRKSA